MEPLPPQSKCHVHLAMLSFCIAGGAAATRRLVWSRFRLNQTLRDDGPLLTSAAFLRGFELLVVGTAAGEVRLHDAYSGENVELVDAHSSPVNLLQVCKELI